MAAYNRLESEEQFWQELDDCLTKRCRTHELIDHTLRTWLYLVAAVREALLHSEDDVANCAHKLLSSLVFVDNKDYVRRQLIAHLLSEDEAAPLHVLAWFLLLEGRASPDSFRLMIEQSCFPRLVELIYRHGRGRGDARLHRLLLEVMFEMSRIERLRREDLMRIDDNFVAHLLQAIDSVSDDARDNPTIRVLLVLNEQYMLATTAPPPDDPTAPQEAPLTNRVMKLLSLEGSSYRNFGENIILLLNREVETSFQFLILKVLYLIFTNKSTYEYFYTNDLKVLIDIILRNLMDLPEDKSTLRHTYLRVLYPLLAHTQLNQPHSHYKQHDILAVLNLVAGQAGSINAHFAPTDETTLRLVKRVRDVDWLKDPSAQNDSDEGSTAADDKGGSGAEESPSQSAIDLTGGVRRAHKDKELAQRLLGMSLSPSETGSTISVSDVAAAQERPGVTTPSRISEISADAPSIDGVVAGELPTGSFFDTPSRTNSLTPSETPIISVQAATPSPSASVSDVASIVSVDSTASGALRSKKPLPQVPKHRHGVLIASVKAAGPATTTTSGTPSPAVTPPAGSGRSTPKKIPPKAPPPRRQRLMAKPSINELAMAARQENGGRD
ncbi:hypothetical protein TD95_004843 [Thielaviopsis punctulata]|uniref:SPIN90/Ldb17 leucine-rich domain-containing protein n=1 Tax=Thielaviopsis punctulata TaxID=72032 RepID=A0A0F4ZCP1_9PEZI|nr:hypothetical protein TD95_004843 [Thielaviopsis punctulata]